MKYILDLSGWVVIEDAKNIDDAMDQASVKTIADMQRGQYELVEIDNNTERTVLSGMW